jgi:predicted XRE-type DNA-binding protein
LGEDVAFTRKIYTVRVIQASVFSLKEFIYGVKYAVVMGELTKPLIDELRSWCKEKRGRQREASQALGVSDSTVSDWFHNRKKMTGDQVIAVQTFLGSAGKGRRR